jgi:hypothetical protein
MASLYHAAERCGLDYCDVVLASVVVASVTAVEVADFAKIGRGNWMVRSRKLESEWVTGFGSAYLLSPRYWRRSRLFSGEGAVGLG